MNKVEMKQLGVAELTIEVESLRRQLFELKMKKVTGHVKDYSQFKKLRVGIAQALTFIGQQSKNSSVGSVVGREDSTDKSDVKSS